MAGHRHDPVSDRSRDRLLAGWVSASKLGELRGDVTVRPKEELQQVAGSDGAH
jgi:hypothetical protein